MSKHINIIARSNGVGLDSDVSLLTQALEHGGHKVTFSHCRSRSLIQKWFGESPQYDANIFLERVFPVWFGSAKKNLLIPNQERFPKRHLKRLKKIDYVLCKTKHAEGIFSKYASTNFISFTSKDINLDNHAPDYSKFFHLAGRSTLKGTDTILRLWEKHPEWPTLTIVQHKDNSPEYVPENIHLITDYLPHEELSLLANKHGIHLCASLSEGWGHYIVEAMSCKAVVITTDAPPMNEIIQSERGILTRVSHSEPRHLGVNFHVDHNALETNIQNAISMSNEGKNLLGENAREWYLKNHSNFQENLLKNLKSIL